MFCYIHINTSRLPVAQVNDKTWLLLLLLWALLSWICITSNLHIELNRQHTNCEWIFTEIIALRTQSTSSYFHWKRELTRIGHSRLLTCKNFEYSTFCIGASVILKPVLKSPIHMIILVRAAHECDRLTGSSVIRLRLSCIKHMDITQTQWNDTLTPNELVSEFNQNWAEWVWTKSERKRARWKERDHFLSPMQWRDSKGKAINEMTGHRIRLTYEMESKEMRRLNGSATRSDSFAAIMRGDYPKVRLN